MTDKSQAVRGIQVVYGQVSRVPYSDYQIQVMPLGDMVLVVAQRPLRGGPVAEWDWLYTRRVKEPGIIGRYLGRTLESNVRDAINGIAASLDALKKQNSIKRAKNERARKVIEEMSKRG